MTGKSLFLSAWALVFAGQAYSSDQPSFELSSAIFDTAPFIKHEDASLFGTYLARNLPYDPIAELKAVLETFLGGKLMGRGEAHITVITPPEYNQLKSHINIEQIHALVEERMQDSVFRPLCMGRWSKKIDSQDESTYYVVVDAEGLLEMRRQIAQAFYDQGGDQARFDANDFYPHITVGFTKRDLHAQDGAKKDHHSCFANLAGFGLN